MSGVVKSVPTYVETLINSGVLSPIREIKQITFNSKIFTNVAEASISFDSDVIIDHLEIAILQSVSSEVLNIQLLASYNENSHTYNYLPVFDSSASSQLMEQYLQGKKIRNIGVRVSFKNTDLEDIDFKISLSYFKIKS